MDVPPPYLTGGKTSRVKSGGEVVLVLEEWGYVLVIFKIFSIATFTIMIKYVLALANLVLQNVIDGIYGFAKIRKRVLLKPQ